MNSENPRVMRKNSKFLTNIRSLNSLGNLLLLAVEGFGDLPNLPFSEEWIKRIHIPKKKRATENGIGLNEYTLSRERKRFGVQLTRFEATHTKMACSPQLFNVLPQGLYCK